MTAGLVAVTEPEDEEYPVTEPDDEDPGYGAG